MKKMKLSKPQIEILQKIEIFGSYKIVSMNNPTINILLNLKAVDKIENSLFLNTLGRQYLEAIKLKEYSTKRKFGNVRFEYNNDILRSFDYDSRGRLGCSKSERRKKINEFLNTP